MGRELGFIALHSGIASGAEAILVPEVKTNLPDLIARLKKGWNRKKSSMIVVVAEGAVKGGVVAIADEVKKHFDQFDIRVSILGHMQRGGNPTCFDRVLASRLGHEAVNAFLEGHLNKMVGLRNNKVCYTSFAKASSGKHSLDKSLLILANELSS